MLLASLPSAKMAAAPAAPALSTPAIPSAVTAVAAEDDKSKYVFVAGAMAGVVEGVAVQPLEFLKTR